MLKHITSICAIILLGTLSTFSQERYTPYDDMPGVEKMYKPAFNESYTGWKRMMYEYPVNYNEVMRDYDAYFAEHGKMKSPIYRYFTFWRRHLEQYVDASGNIVLPNQNDLKSAQVQEYEKQMQSSRMLKSSSANSSDWTFLGPKTTYWENWSGMGDDRKDAEGNPLQCPWQVNVYSIDVSESDNSIVYCGTETGFVSKTTNKGLSWQLLSLDYSFGGGIPAVAIHPTNPDIVYVSGGSQMHKTIDGGVTWTPLLAPENKFNAQRLRISPVNPEIVIAGAWDGFYITKDGGQTWARNYGQTVWDVEFKPGDPSVVYALSKSGTGYFQVVVSTDGGDTFGVARNWPNNMYREKSGGLLAVTPANPDIVYVTMLCKETKDGEEDGIPYVLKGTINIAVPPLTKWEVTKKGSYFSDVGLGGFSNGQGYFDLVLEASPTNADLVYFGTCSFFKSTNGGVDFDAVGGYWGPFPIHPDIQDMKIMANGDTWVSTDGGVNLSTDDFTLLSNHSSRTSELVGSDMWGFDQGWNEDLIVGGRYHNGNTAIADFYGEKALRLGGGESPTGWIMKGRSRHAVFDDLGRGMVLPKTATGFKEDKRFNFAKHPNMDYYGGERSNLVHHPNYYDWLYLGEGDGFWKSEDMGESFDLLHQFPGRVRYLEVSHLNPNVFYVDVVGNGLYRSGDGGQTWQRKPSLTAGSYGNSSWNGKLFFVISPTDENTIYACKQNAGDGKVFKSEDGGNTWTDFTDGVSAQTKGLAIQPTNSGQDLVYLIGTAGWGNIGSVYYRYENDANWSDYGNNYPHGMRLNIAMPFYRDGKLRSAGNSGVWETPLVEQVFTPVINAWSERAHYNCMTDTIYFEDHSMVNHAGAQWNWEITPAPAFISDANIRNPKVVTGSPGSYDIKLSITQNGTTYSRTFQDMVTTTTCPSVNDCSNPTELDQKLWTLVGADSQQAGEGWAIHAFDGNDNTFWHTQWSGAQPDHPHQITIDLGREYSMSKLIYLPRQNSGNGRIKDYEFFITNDQGNWGTPALDGAFESGDAPKKVDIPNVAGRYIKMRTLSNHQGDAFATIAELNLVGCIDNGSTGIEKTPAGNINAYPIPAQNTLTIDLPRFGGDKQWRYQIVGINGQVRENNVLDGSLPTHTFDVSQYAAGIYFIVLKNQNGKTFRVKFVVQ